LNIFPLYLVILIDLWSAELIANDRARTFELHNVPRAHFANPISPLLVINLIDQQSQLFSASSNRAIRNLIREFAGGSQRLIVILEHSDRFESIFDDEVFENVEILLALSRKPDDKTRPHDRLREVGMNETQEIVDMLSIIVPTHETKNLFARVLKGHIEVGNKLFERFELI
jgi:hypothetical protein